MEIQPYKMAPFVNGETICVQVYGTALSNNTYEGMRAAGLAHGETEAGMVLQSCPKWGKG